MIYIYMIVVAVDQKDGASAITRKRSDNNVARWPILEELTSRKANKLKIIFPRLESVPCLGLRSTLERCKNTDNLPLRD